MSAQRGPNRSTTGPVSSAAPLPINPPAVSAPVNSVRVQPNVSVTGFSRMLSTGNVSTAALKLPSPATATTTHP